MKNKTNAINMTSLGEVIKKDGRGRLNPEYGPFQNLMKKLSLRKVKPKRKVTVLVKEVTYIDDETGHVFFRTKKIKYAYWHLCRLKKESNL